MKKHSLPCLLVIVLAAVLGSGCRPSGPSVEAITNAGSSANCYQVEFLGMTESSEVASTWRYHVRNQACPQTAGIWVLELPSCASVVDASPAPWDTAGPGEGTGMSGVRWQTGSDFQDGEFSVTLTGSLQEGMSRAGVKGPVCRDLAVQTATSVPMAKVKVQSANCRAKPVGKADKVVILYRNQEAEIVGRNEDPNNPWWYVKIPDQERNCWLWGKTTTTDGDVDGLPILK